MRKLQYTFKTDTLFKMLFSRQTDLLKKLVAVLLKIPLQDITEFSIQNPEIPSENLGDKFCRLDINMRVNGQWVDLEIQVIDRGDYKERVLFYWAKEFSSSLASGGNYADLPRTIIISITDFSLFVCQEYHSFFQPLETSRYELLSDKMGFHFFELPKLPETVNKTNEMEMWLSLFKAETEEDLEKIKALEVPEMKQAIDAYYTITASEEFREKERLRERARHDEAQALYHAKKEGIAEGRVKGRAEGRVEGVFDTTMRDIQNIMDSFKVPLDQAMTALKVPESERPRYKEMLQPQ